MAPVRLFAILSLALLAGYHGLGVLARHCSGTRCDVFIGLSLLVPLLILIAVGVTGLVTATTARSAGHTTWVRLVVVLTLLGVVGPIATALVFRDSPDVVVYLATILLAVLPISTLCYSWFARAGESAAPRVGG